MVKIKEHYQVKIPKFLKAQALTIGQHIFYQAENRFISNRLRNHEMKHVEQYREIGIPRFLFLYMVEYCWNRLKGLSKKESYRQISFEIEARKVERN